MKKIIALAVCALMMLGMLAGCGTKVEPDESSAVPTVVEDVQAVQGAGKLVVGVTVFEPMDYQDEAGNWAGFDADMAKAFAETLGVKAEFMIVDWDTKAVELDNGTIDCVWNGMTLTDDVRALMDCSKPYCNNQQVIVVKKDVADKYQTAEACKELKFAVENGSAGQEQAEAYGFDFTPVVDQATTLMEVASGTCDAAIIDSLMAAAMVGEGTGYADLTYTVGLNDEQYGVGFRKGSDLVAKLDEFLDAAKADGTLEKIAEQYKVQAALIK